MHETPAYLRDIFYYDKYACMLYIILNTPKYIFIKLL